MRIIHTADWHLGRATGGIPRWQDQLAQIEKILKYCDEYVVDVLLVAGDLFETGDPQRLAPIMTELADRLRPLVANGMSVLLLPGNHDRDSLFPLMETVQALGGERVRGTARVSFHAKPTIVVKRGRDGQAVRFVTLPWPRPSAYLTGTEPLEGRAEMHARLAQAWRDQKDQLVERARSLGNEPLVLASHVLVRNQDIGGSCGLTELEDVPIEEGDLPLLDYVALGHVHKPQTIGGRRWAQYSGAIERFDLGEAEHDRGVVLVELSQSGLAADPVCLPLDPCPFIEVSIDGAADLEGLAGRFADSDARRAYAKVTLRHGPGDDLQAMERHVRDVFPRCYQLIREPTWATVAAARIEGGGHDIAATTRAYVARAIPDEVQRERVLGCLDSLLLEELRS